MGSMYNNQKLWGVVEYGTIKPSPLSQPKKIAKGTFKLRNDSIFCHSDWPFETYFEKIQKIRERNKKDKYVRSLGKISIEYGIPEKDKKQIERSDRIRKSRYKKINLIFWDIYVAIKGK